jgi:hypothetical protein
MLRGPCQARGRPPRRRSTRRVAGRLAWVLRGCNTPRGRGGVAKSRPPARRLPGRREPLLRPILARPAPASACVLWSAAGAPGPGRPLLIQVSDLSATAGQDAGHEPAFPIRRRGLLRLGGLCAAGRIFIAAPSAPAGSHHDHDRAREALERGEALPLADILARVRLDRGGEVVGVSFEREDGRWIYAFKVVGATGLLAEGMWTPPRRAC